jgi:hypothetical protein
VGGIIPRVVGDGAAVLGAVVILFVPVVGAAEEGLIGGGGVAESEFVSWNVEEMQLLAILPTLNLCPLFASMLSCPTNIFPVTEFWSSATPPGAMTCRAIVCFPSLDLPSLLLSLLLLLSSLFLDPWCLKLVLPTIVK